MRQRLLPVIALLAVGVALPADDARAVTCYIVFDRSDNVIYRDLYPPVDLSDAGRVERDALRARGEFLMFLESEQCPRIEYFTGAAGSVGLRLEDTLAPSAQPAQDPSKPVPMRAPRAPRKPAAKAG
jgi:hypothetical protein